jgi:gliding motility-associated-like protein
MRCWLIFFAVCFSTSALAQFNNKKPHIAGQYPAVMDEDKSYFIALNYLIVEDRDDWFYPWGFSLQVYPGENYSVSNATIVPTANFFGTLEVPVTVHDGEDFSNTFKFKIEVRPVNDRPQIISQTNKPSVQQQKALSLTISDIIVTDPDNSPSDFTIAVLPSVNGTYTASGNQVTPSMTSIGDIYVRISVSDGQAESDVFPFIITVLPANETPRIISQIPLTINEDESIELTFSHLSVEDRDNPYPNGFTLTTYGGDDYTVNKNTVTPSPNFNGTLTIPVSVNDGNSESQIFLVSIEVISINDPPEIVAFEVAPIPYKLDQGPVNLTEIFNVVDHDHDFLISAEIGFLSNQYRIGNDQLLFSNTSKITGSFDTNTGQLKLSGQATPADYRDAIRSVQYNYVTIIEPVRENKFIYIKVSDGVGSSEEKTRIVQSSELPVDLDIPTGFTPNGDLANDTWVITPLTQSENSNRAVIRVYNRHGVLLFETVGFENSWDGMFKGEVLPPDTYYYSIDFRLRDSPSSVKGVVTLLR